MQKIEDNGLFSRHINYSSFIKKTISSKNQNRSIYIYVKKQLEGGVLQEGFGGKLVALMLILSTIFSAMAAPKFGALLIASANFLSEGTSLEDSLNGSKPSFLPETLKEEENSQKSPQKTESATSETNPKPKKDSKPAGKVLEQTFSPQSANTSYNNTYLNNKTGVNVDIKKLLESDKTALKKGSDLPQILIVHTHATEKYLSEDKSTYTDSDLERTKSSKESVVGVGEKVAKLLEKGGIKVIHDKTLHDSPSYSGAYSRSYQTVSEILSKNKDIKLVLDIHRDAIASGDDLIKPIAEIGGKKAAQVMICVGSETGSVADFPNWQKNLSVGLRLQQGLEVLYPGLARPLYLAYEREYNQSLFGGSIIVEFGTCANSVEEAQYSAELVANAILSVFVE